MIVCTLCSPIGVVWALSTSRVQGRVELHILLEYVSELFYN